MQRLPELEVVQRINVLAYPGLLENPAYLDEDEGSRSALFAQPPIWSPDGRYLAFAGAIDGPSADVYVYDGLTNEVRRLTSGPNHAMDLVWSPDSRWILHREVTRFGHGCYEVAMWAAAADGSQVRRLFDSRCGDLAGWINDSSFIAFNRDWTSFWGVVFVDLAANQIRTLYADSFWNYAFDPRHAIFAFAPTFSRDGSPPTLNGRLYMVTPNARAPIFVSDQVINISWNPQVGYITTTDISCGRKQVAALLPDATFFCLDLPTKEDLANRWPSPDGKKAVLASKGTWLEGPASEQARQLSKRTPETVLWRPDSKGAFLQIGTALYYLDATQGSISEIAQGIEWISWAGIP